MKSKFANLLNPLASRDVFGRTKFFADFVLLTDFDDIKMPNFGIQPSKIKLKP